MSFPTAAYLRKATGRAKSDVANKLVDMFLHEVSRKITEKIGLSVGDENTSVPLKPSSEVIAVTAIDCWKATEQQLNIPMA